MKVFLTFTNRSMASDRHLITASILT